MDEATVISNYFSKLGKSKSTRKQRTSRENIVKAYTAKASPIEQLEAGYVAVRSGKMDKSRAAREVAKARYPRFKEYCRRRENGETVKQIREKP